MDKKLANVTPFKLFELSGLVEAVATRQLTFVLQAKFDSSLEIVGAELLSRWVSEDYGSVSPTDFMSQAEANGLADEIGKQAINHAAFCISTLAQAGYCIPVSVNISACQLMVDGLIDVLKKACNKHNIECSQIELELTETVLLNHSNEVKQRVFDLSSAGYKIVLDDFGAGYSSLSYLREYDFYAVKIDKEFLDNIEVGGKAKVLLGSMISLCKSLGLRVIVEGVENQCQLKIVREFNVEQYQGFLLSKPLSLYDFLKELNSSGDVISSSL